MLWPDSTETQARANLRNLVHSLQHGLPHVGKRLEMGTGTLGWRPDATVVLDLADFEAAVNAADAARRSADNTAAQAQLEAAVAIYRRELLPGFYDDWIVAERDRLNSLARHALDGLVDLLEAQRDYARAIVHAERLLQQDRLNETTYRRLMRLHVLAGDHAGARRVYRACVDVLRRELGEEPAGATREAYAVAQREVEDPRPAGDQPSRWPLVGRQPEWASLRKYFQAGNSGTRLLLIVGEAGVGKTRLAEELVEWRRGHGDLPAVAACYRGGVISYAPLAAWLRTPGVEAARAGLRDLWLGEVGRIVPEVLADRPDLTPRPITEDWQRQHLFEALARALVAPGEPLILVVEDLHWCDHATLEFLGFFLRWQAPRRVVVCATARVEELVDQPGIGPLLEALRRDGRLQEVELAPLDPAQTSQLAAHVVGRTLDAAASEALYHETEGNALHVVETLRAGTLGPLPVSVQAVIAARLGQLSPPARELAGLAATIGREFRFPFLARAAGHPDEVVVAQLDELIQRRVVREHDGMSYDFSHDKIRMVAYAQLSTARRRLLHARVAEALEALEPDLDAISAVLAHHSEASGNSERAVVLYQQAAQAARSVYANADALAHTRRALALLGSLQLTREARAWRARTESALQESLGDMLTMMRRHPEAIAAYQAARNATAAEDAIGQARLHRKEANAHETQQDYPTALALLDRAEATLGPEPAVANQAWWQEWRGLVKTCGNSP